MKYQDILNESPTFVRNKEHNTYFVAYESYRLGLVIAGVETYHESSNLPLVRKCDHLEIVNIKEVPTEILRKADNRCISNCSDIVSIELELRKSKEELLEDIRKLYNQLELEKELISIYRNDTTDYDSELDKLREEFSIVMAKKYHKENVKNGSYHRSIEKMQKSISKKIELIANKS